MRPIGFSTGAVAKADFERSLDKLRQSQITVVEISAIRIGELDPLCQVLPHLDLHDFTFVSVHAPSSFDRNLEPWVVSHLSAIAHLGIPVVAHPDTILEPALWTCLRDSLLLENMDKRKPIGRTTAEMRMLFALLPQARFCFDIGHARQVDPSMAEAAALLRAYGNRLVQVHMSEVNTASRHDPISLNATRAFQAVASYIPEDVPIILETLIDQGQSTIEKEIARARESLPIAPAFTHAAL